MKTQHSQTSTKATSLPGEDRGRQLSLVCKVVESLAPGVAGDCPDFVQLLTHYLLLAQDDPSRGPLENAIAYYLRHLEQQGYEVEKEDLMISIRGMQAIMDELQLQSLNELEQYTQANKAACQSYMHQAESSKKTDHGVLPDTSHFVYKYLT